MRWQGPDARMRGSVTKGGVERMSRLARFFRLSTIILSSPSSVFPQSYTDIIQEVWIVSWAAGGNHLALVGLLDHGIVDVQPVTTGAENAAGIMASTGQVSKVVYDSKESVSCRWLGTGSRRKDCCERLSCV